MTGDGATPPDAEPGEVPSADPVAGPRAPDPAVYNALVAGMRIRAVDTIEIRAERDPLVAVESADFEVGIGHQIDGGVLRHRYTVKATFRDDGGVQCGHVHAALVLTTEWPDLVGDDSATMFGSTSGSLVVHPYLRETVSSTSARLGVPGVLLPVLTFVPARPPDDDAPTGTSLDDAAGRPP